MLPDKSTHWITLLGGAMAFDPCPHKITQVVLKAGAIIRQLKGLPVEPNVTILYNETAPILGVEVVAMTSRDANHLPSPGEMKTQDGTFIVPRKPCPKCGGSMALNSICPSCTDSEGGKYKSAYRCESCQFIDEKSEKFITQRLTEMGIEVQTGPKQEMGIKTITDDGLK
jgi:hypothetical protein